jgi:ATP-binding cassette, subfamily B, bacterial HlyB/CyaB
VTIHSQALTTGSAPSSAQQHAGASAPPHGGVLHALCAIARLHQIAADPAALAHQRGWPAQETLQIDDLLLAAKHLGLQAKRSRTNAERLALTPLPALAVMHTPDGSLRVVIVAQCDGQGSIVLDGQILGRCQRSA